MKFLLYIARWHLIDMVKPFELVFNASLKLRSHPPIIVVGRRVHEVTPKVELSGGIIDQREALEGLQGIVEGVEPQGDLVVSAHGDLPKVEVLEVFQGPNL